MAIDIQVSVLNETGTTVVEDNDLSVVAIASEQHVVVGDDAVQVVSIGEQAPAVTGGGGGYNPYAWNVFKNSISVGETCTVPAGYFLLGVESFSIEGVLDNHGRVLIL